MSDIFAEVAAGRVLSSPAMGREIRLAAGVSQARVAQELGVQRVTVARWESGKRRPRGQMLVDYARLLNRLQSLGQS